MASDQKTTFLDVEGDGWFERNQHRPDPATELMIQALKIAKIAPSSVLEIGSSAGRQLQRMHEEFGCQCYGLEPSEKAIEYGKSLRPWIEFKKGTADRLPYADGQFDLVIFGFCLYLCDPPDLFRIACEADRVLRDKGVMLIKDFSSPSPYRSNYSHVPGMHSYKMDWSKMFGWHPAYKLIFRTYSEQTAPYSFHPNEQIAIDLLRKDVEAAFPDSPYR